MKRAKSICRKVGCNKLVDSPGYCQDHKHIEKNRFKGLRKAEGSRAFYGSSKWRKCSLAYREANPLCAECKRNGLVVKGDLVDHMVERPTLIARGDDPYDWQHLQTLCQSCHNKKLRERQKAVADKIYEKFQKN